MFGVIPKALWEKMSPPDSKNRIPMQTNCLLLEKTSNKKTTRILIETGYGSRWSPKERDIFSMEDRTIVDALAEHKIEPETINHVFVTHLHFDHAGGLTKPCDPSNYSSDPISVFENATIWVQAKEWEDALANKSTMSKTYLKNHLKPIEKQIHTLYGECSPLGQEESISVKTVPGHTWGQQAILFEDSKGTVTFPGDLIPTKNHVGLPFSMGYDMLPYENMETKKYFLELASEKNWRIVLDHEIANPVFFVQTENIESNKFKLIPANS